MRNMGEDKVNLSAKLIDPVVSKSFESLTSDDENERCNGGTALLEYMSKNADDQKKSTQRDYILNRLVRGLGASTCSSKTGFFTTLTEFLKIPFNESLTVGDIFKVMSKELHVGKEIKNKEDSDAFIGHILLCGSLIDSNKLNNAADEDLSQCINVLTAASNHKMEHSSMAYTYLIKLLSELPSDQFNAKMWPILKQELERPWERQNINTITFLMAVHAKYPDLVNSEYLESSIKVPEILSTISFKHLGRMFWGISIADVMHPAYDVLAQFLCRSKSKQLVKFWQQEVNECLAAPNKPKEIVTIKILTEFFNNTSIETKTLLKLLSGRFIKMIVNSLKNVKQQHVYLPAYYEEFFEAVNKRISKMTEDNEKVEIITKFILHPGALSIEKYTTQNVVRQMIKHLGTEGVKRLTDIFKRVFIGELTKDPTDTKVQWLNVEKEYAAQMMQLLIGLKIMQNEVNWRIEQSKFMAGVSFFYISKDGVPITEENDSGFITKDLWMNVKNVFYSSRPQPTLPHLKDEKRMLLTLVKFCNEILSMDDAKKYLREPLSKNSKQCWSKMFQFVISSEEVSKKDKKLNLIFRILFMHMGLQLFREPEMAELAIVDLEKCIENINKKKIQSHKMNANDEPEWIEVVVDLFLHLLSQSTKFLKVVVNTLFPHLCAAMTLTAVHQILSVLDMKVSNPLSNANDADENADEEKESVDEGDDIKLNGGDENTSDESGNDEEEDNSDSESEEDENQDDENEEDDDVMEEDEGTVSDQLRNAVSTVLGAVSDTESIDLNDMTDEEVKRLDRDLSAAFQLMRKSNPKKKSKKERTIATTVMHFRIRVLDLIEIYLQSASSMAICLEIMLALFNMIELCVESDLKPLSIRIDKVLGKLLNLRHFDNVTDVTEQQLRDLLTGLIERKVNPTKVENYNKLLSKSVAFVVSNLHLVRTTDDSVVAAITGYAKEFLNTRNPTIAFSLLQDIFKLRWLGVWKISLSLSTYSFKATTQIRSFRRSQFLELLGIMYRNKGFILEHEKSIKKSSGAIVAQISRYLDGMHQMDNTKEKPKSKEFLSLVSLLCDLYKCSQKVQSLKLNEKIDWKLTGDKIQNIRQKVILASDQPYQQFCRRVSIKPLKKCDVQAVQQNGHVDNEHTRNDDNEKVKNNRKRNSTERTTNGEEEDAKTQKKQKKLRKEERLRISSEGFNGISFAASNDNVSMELSSDCE